VIAVRRLLLSAIGVITRTPLTRPMLDGIDATLHTSANRWHGEGEKSTAGEGRIHDVCNHPTTHPVTLS
jgi:hypothetical protein